MRSCSSVLRARRRPRSSATASPTVGAFAHSRGNSAQKTRAQVRASGSARCTSVTSIPSASASVARPRLRASGAKRRARVTVQSEGGRGQSSPARSNAWRSTARSKRALCAISTRPSSSAASSGSTSSGGGAPAAMACVMPVKRWMPRESGRSVRTSESHVS